MIINCIEKDWALSVKIIFKFIVKTNFSLNLENDICITILGPLSVPFAIEANAWIQEFETVPDWPDLQFLMVSATPGIDHGMMLRDKIGYNKDVNI